MKRKFASIDTSIISGYMGRFFTAIAATLVLTITVHALVTRDTARRHATLRIVTPAGEAADFYEPLQRLIARRTGRSVILAPGDWDTPAELYIMPAWDFMRRRESMELRALFALGACARDRAVLVAGATVAEAEAASVENVVFTGPNSPNGCWVQLRALAERGAVIPPLADSLYFPPTPDPSRVLHLVADGRASFGACRQSDLTRLLESGGLDAGELRVVLDLPALPELIIAAREGDTRYLVDELGGLGAEFVMPSSARNRDAIALLRERGVGSFRPVSLARLAELEALYEFMSPRIAEDAAPSNGSP